MVALESHVDPADPVFQSNRERMQQLVAELRERLSRAREGGGAKYVHPCARFGRDFDCSDRQFAPTWQIIFGANDERPRIGIADHCIACRGERSAAIDGEQNQIGLADDEPGGGNGGGG